MDLQVRRSHAQGRGGRDSGAQRRHGELSVGSSAELEFGGEVVSQAGRSSAESRIVGAVGRSEEAGRSFRHGPGKDDGGRAYTRVSSREPGREVEGTHGQQGAEFRIEQRGGNAAGF